LKFTVTFASAVTLSVEAPFLFGGDARMARLARDVTSPLSTDDEAEVLRKLQGSIYFEKAVTASSAAGYLIRDPILVCLG
jgi:hypothetical protein